MKFVLQFENGEYITEYETDDTDKYNPGKIWFDQSQLEDLVWHINCCLDSRERRLEVVLPPGVESRRTCC